jgi:hypothetical protein
VTIWCMRIACWITKATDTHSEYVLIRISFSTATMVERTHLNVALYVLRTACLYNTEAKSIPGQCMGDLWWTKWHWDRFLSVYVGLPKISENLNIPRKPLALGT